MIVWTSIKITIIPNVIQTIIKWFVLYFFVGNIFLKSFIIANEILTFLNLFTTILIFIEVWYILITFRL